MNQEIATTQQHQVAPFGQQGSRALTSGAMNVGAVEIESQRAIAETQGKLVLAKRFPRDIMAAHAELMVACKSKAFAAVAFYAKPQGGGTVSGPSIRMAEQIAQVYGNFDYGHRELSRDDRKSEIEVYAWDMEKNNYTRRQKTVLHVRDTKDGPKKLRDQSEIDGRINNIGSKESRGLLLAMMPKWLVEDAVQECRKTLAGNNEEPLEARVRKMAGAFAKYGVTQAHLERHLGHKLDAILLDELVDLQGIYNSLKDGTPASELFPAPEEADEDKPSGLAETARKGAEAKAAAPVATPAPTPAPTAAPVGGEAQKPAGTAKPKAEPKKSNPTQVLSNPVNESQPEVAPEQQDNNAQSALLPDPEETTAGERPAVEDIF